MSVGEAAACGVGLGVDFTALENSVEFPGVEFDMRKAGSAFGVDVVGIRSRFIPAESANVADCVVIAGNVTVVIEVGVLTGGLLIAGLLIAGLFIDPIFVCPMFIDATFAGAMLMGIAVMAAEFIDVAKEPPDNRARPSSSSTAIDACLLGRRPVAGRLFS